MKKNILLIGMLASTMILVGQEKESYGPISTITATSFKVTERINDIPDEKENTYEVGGSMPNMRGRIEHVSSIPLPNGVDPVWQKTKGTGVLKSPTAGWNGISGANPPDPSGAVGPTTLMRRPTKVRGRVAGTKLGRTRYNRLGKCGGIGDVCVSVCVCVRAGGG